MNNDEIDLTPNYPVLRRQFSRNARLRADTILADLLPEALIPAEYIKQVQRDVLREFQGILNSIDVVAQCTTNTEELVELRELIHEVSQAIVAKADAIERAMEDNQHDAIYRVFNVTDQIYASMELMTQNEGTNYMRSFRESFASQGYYKTAAGDRISPDQVVLELRQGAAPPHPKFTTSDGYTLHWNTEHHIWADSKDWESRDMVFGAGPDGWPMDDFDEAIEGNYIKENK